METTRTTTSLSDVRVYTHGLVSNGCGAYAYAVLGGDYPAEPLNRFSQAGRATDAVRMKMRAVYEGVRHCPDGVRARVYVDDLALSSVLGTATGGDANADIAERYRAYIREHRITPAFVTAGAYLGDDLPCNDHDEWVWYSHQLCEDAIEKHLKEQKTSI